MRCAHFGKIQILDKLCVGVRDKVSQISNADKQFATASERKLKHESRSADSNHNLLPKDNARLSKATLQPNLQKLLGLREATALHMHDVLAKYNKIDRA